jgi:hypothetical protein
MQFSFVVSMPQKFNTSTLRTQEVSRIKEYIGKTVLPSIVEQAKNKFVGGILQDVVNTSASPTILEYYAESLSSILKGKKPGKIVKKSKASAKNTEAIAVSAILKDPKKLKLKSRSGGTKVKPEAIRLQPTVELSLTSLQTLLDANLVQRVKQNMGSGSSRTVLNLRSGRLAESAKVERLSESRAGMITAFYSYMKNPYATFSDGGLQSSPRSRDPKALISKSIREIAQQQVANRLRAVAI